MIFVGINNREDPTAAGASSGAGAAAAAEEKPKKASRSEVTDRWGHDMFDESQQGPKSDQELFALYGYDIRKEEGAPR